MHQPFNKIILLNLVVAYPMGGEISDNHPVQHVLYGFFCNRTIELSMPSSSEDRYDDSIIL